MNKLKLQCLVFAASFVASFSLLLLLWAFVNASLNPFAWTTEARTFLSLFTVVGGLFGGAVTNVQLSDAMDSRLERQLETMKKEIKMLTENKGDNISQGDWR